MKEFSTTKNAKNTKQNTHFFVIFALFVVDGFSEVLP
jgi:hypothetical protein